MSKNIFMGQTILFETSLFGKAYFWMRDIDQTTYLVKSKDGVPDFS